MTLNLINLLNQPEKNVLFVGIGNVLKQDDGVGVFISNNIKGNNRISKLTVEVSIENYIGKINSLNPDILVLIDCVEMNATPGSYRIFSLSQLEDLTFNTHNISLKKLSEFFSMSVYILGIQPEKLDFGENITYLVKKEATKLINLINNQEVPYGN